MSVLRQQMIQTMTQHGLASKTHKAYLASITAFANYFHQPPDKIDPDQLQIYFDYLVQQKHLSSSSCRVQHNALRFLYQQVLKNKDYDIPIKYPKRPQVIPELLTHKEVKNLIESCSNEKHKMMLLVCYGCGLRVSELVALKLADIDSERQRLRIEQGKGGKDRLVFCSDKLLYLLRIYWQHAHPVLWLFPNERDLNTHLSISTIQRVYTSCKKRANIIKKGGIHSLRHTYATHQLANGLPPYE